jgi:hypothetical protein
MPRRHSRLVARRIARRLLVLTWVARGLMTAAVDPWESALDSACAGVVEVKSADAC